MKVLVDVPDGWSHGEYITWAVCSDWHNESLVDVVKECEVIGNIYEHSHLLDK